MDSSGGRWRTAPGRPRSRSRPARPQRRSCPRASSGPRSFDTPPMAGQFGAMTRRAGFTLIEMLVVLVLMGLAVALVAPALFPARHDESALRALLGSARDAAARRGEVVYLRIDVGGRWRMEPVFATPVTLVVSPLGSCAFDVRSSAAAAVVALEPLTCDLRAP